MGVTLPDKIHNFGLSSVGKVEEILKSNFFDESIECFNELILVNFSF